MNRQWYHINNLKESVSYGFAVDLDTKKVVACNERIAWAMGQTLEFMEKFFEDKPVTISPIITEKNEAEQPV